MRAFAQVPAPEPSVFYAIVSHVLLVPMIGLSAVATVIASQALLSGAYSLTQQAVQLGFSTWKWPLYKALPLCAALMVVDVGFLKPSERVDLDALGEGFYRVIARFGYMETPNVPDLLAATGPTGLAIDPARTTYYLGRETLIPGKTRGMRQWQKRIFAVVSRNASSATSYFGIPPNRVVELGMQVEL